MQTLIQYHISKPKTTWLKQKLKLHKFLNPYFANQSTVDDTDAVLPILELPSYPPLSDIYISVNDVKDAISLLKPSKAPGPDLVTPKLL